MFTVRRRADEVKSEFTTEKWMEAIRGWTMGGHESQQLALYCAVLSKVMMEKCMSPKTTAVTSLLIGKG